MYAFTLYVYTDTFTLYSFFFLNVTSTRICLLYIMYDLALSCYSQERYVGIIDVPSKKEYIPKNLFINIYPEKFDTYRKKSNAPNAGYRYVIL